MQLQMLESVTNMQLQGDLTEKAGVADVSKCQQ